jgi:hypothetical protein
MRGKLLPTVSSRRRRCCLASALASVLALATCAGAGARISGRAADAAAPTAEPVAGISERITRISGTVRVREKGTPSFVVVTEPVLVTDGSEVDARSGIAEVTVSAGAGLPPASGLASKGQFVVHQDATGPMETHLTLSQAIGCGARRGKKAQLARINGPHGRRPRSRQLYVSDGGGHWGTNAKYVSTSVEGTQWLTRDECRRSLVRVASGIVLVRDLIHHTSATVTAGHQYVVTSPEPEAAGFVPFPGRVLAGQSGADPAAFSRQTGKHAAIFGYFATWGQQVGSLIGFARSLHERLLVHLSTDQGYGPSAGQILSPAAIARGAGDNYLTSLCEELSGSRQPVYIAFLPEMNQANNAYSAYAPNGASRGPSNSTGAFRQAWRRAALILRGGPLTGIDRRLRALGMPVVRGHATDSLPRPKVSLMWAPQTAGSPDIRANGPAAYFPGAGYVDIVGTDFYSAFPNFSGLTSLYDSYRNKPFGFNEWAMWQNPSPSFVTQLFAWVRTHRRTALMVYNEGLQGDGPFRLTKFPAARAAIRRELASARFLPFPPGA